MTCTHGAPECFRAVVIEANDKIVLVRCERHHHQVLIKRENVREVEGRPFLLGGRGSAQCECGEWFWIPDRG